MLMTHYQNVGNNSNKIANKSFENVGMFKYFWMAVTYKNCIYEEIKSRLDEEYLLLFCSETFVILSPF
jgi:hypothetical protein